MSGIREVRFADLFWSTLETHRGTGHYVRVLEKISHVVEQKFRDRKPVNRNDLPDVEDSRHDIWHCRILATPDVVLFYVMDGDAMTLAMVGSHADLTRGRKSRQSERAIRASAYEGGDNVARSWSAPRWHMPQDLIDSPEIMHLDTTALRDLHADVVAEMQSGEKLERVLGPIETVPEPVFDAWLDGMDRVSDKIRQEIERRRTPEGLLKASLSPERVFRPLS
jgi:hypothetical protein